MWYFDQTGLLGYPIFAGAYLGLSAGCLWTTAAFTSTAYPEERDKGRWRSILWSANVSGSAVGAAVALGISWNSTSESVPHSVYIVFIVLQCCSSCFALLVQQPEKLRRGDGTALATFGRISLSDTIRITGRLLTDWRILTLIPCMFAPEMFFPFQASMNAYAFNLRTRILNSLLNNLIQIPTCIFLGYILDNEKLGPRQRRAFIGITFDAVWITGTYIAQTAWLDSWKFDRSVPGPTIDCTDPAYVGAVVIYMLYAAQYGIFQNMVLYILGTLTNEPRKTAAIGGLLIGGRCHAIRSNEQSFLTSPSPQRRHRSLVRCRCHCSALRERECGILRARNRVLADPVLHCMEMHNRHQLPDGRRCNRAHACA